MYTPNRDSGFDHYTQKRIAHWDNVARNFKPKVWIGKYYHRRLKEIYQYLVRPGLRVLEIGCGSGDLLAALDPSIGVGVDFSSEMIISARKRYQHLYFLQADACQLALDERFDVIILSDLVNDLWDVQRVFQQIKNLSSPHTRIILNFYSRVWEAPLKLAERLGLSTRTLEQNWLTADDIINLMNLCDFEVIRHWEEILWPLPGSIISSFFNRILVKLWPIRFLALSNFVVARPFQYQSDIAEKPLVSVIIPARNEAGNIAELFDRIPEMGQGTELIFVEGHSNDDTYNVINDNIASNPDRVCSLYRQTGVGKGDAVRLGFSHANGEVLMILDADISVPPEDLTRFLDALCSGKGEFINGVRLVYPLETHAMRYFNLLGNKFFSLIFSWLIGQHIKDTLCGTKVLWKRDYETIAANRAYFGDFDPFGDFDLIFGATKLNLKIIDMPIRYRERTYGSTNIQRWKHGWLLLKMMFFAAGRIKFV